MSINPRVSIFTTHYDNIGRLTKAGTDTFAYDKAGNNQNNAATYNTKNNQMNENLLYKITYDAMGNIATKYNKLTQHTSNYTFNARNQLTSYSKLDENNNTTKTLSYTYDAFNRRVSKTEDNVEQKYLYDGDDIVALLDSSNQVIATITHDESIDTPLSITNANGTFYYHRDHQGSIVALTDSAGTVVESFTYDNHYGTITDHTINTVANNPYGYTGRELDTEELYYYRARYYDATLERFIGEDPIGFMSGDFNFYRYVGNSAVNFNDANGLLAASLSGGGSIGGHLGFGGGNISGGLGYGSNGPFYWFTVCFRLGFGFGVFAGGVVSGGIDPFPEKSDCLNKDCVDTWSFGAGGDLGLGGSYGAAGGIGSGGVNGLRTKGGGGYGFSGGIEICVTRSCLI
jgi:RHS repeat-associated protein